MRRNDIYATWNENADHENKKLDRKYLQCVQKKFVMKYLNMNQNIYKSKLLPFHKFNWF